MKLLCLFIIFYELYNVVHCLVHCWRGRLPSDKNLRNAFFMLYGLLWLSCSWKWYCVIREVVSYVGDDAVGVKWMDIGCDVKLYASHTDMIRKVAEHHGAHWWTRCLFSELVIWISVSLSQCCGFSFSGKHLVILRLILWLISKVRAQSFIDKLDDEAGWFSVL